MGHDGVVSSHTISTGFPQVDEVSTGPSDFEVSQKCIFLYLVLTYKNEKKKKQIKFIKKKQGWF